jgi:hypothetical protein
MNIKLVNRQIHTCHHCGHQSKDMTLGRAYIGGVGYRFFWYCNDIAACWQRFENKKE